MQTPEKTKFWISKYYATKGIFEAECEVPSYSNKLVASYKHHSNPEWHCYIIGLSIGKDAHITKEEAIKAAEAAREKKIESLQKQIKNLEKMVF
jgi:hypothetical protein